MQLWQGILVLCGISCLTVVQADIRAGEWEISSSVSMNGTPIAGTETKQKLCLDQKKMLAYLENVTEGMKRNGDKCELLKSEMRSVSYTWKMQCQGMVGLPGQVVGEGKFKISTLKIEGDMVFTSKVLYTNMLSFTINNHFLAIRLGECSSPKK